MAEATGKSSTAFEDLMMVVFAMLLVAGAVRQVPQILQNKLGVDIGAPYLVASAAIGADTPLGTAVATVNGTPFYATPGTTDTSGGEFGPGTSLVLRQGPKTMIGGVRWWYVEDAATGNAGWVPESALVRDGVGGVGPATALGTKVRTLLTTDIWDAAGGTDKVGTAAKGTAGTLTNGPTETGGVRWWYFERDGSGASGWVPESALLLSSGKDWRAGSAVRATQDADLFEHPGGGQALGSVRNGDELRIVGGPSLSGGAYWWLVQTQDGAQGWMPESGIADGGI